jgi:hypothetical protein
VRSQAPQLAVAMERLLVQAQAYFLALCLEINLAIKSA